MVPELSEHVTSNYSTEPSWQRQHDAVISTDIRAMEGKLDPDMSPHSYGYQIFDKIVTGHTHPI